MKKILFVAIVTLGLVGCAGGGRSKADTGTAEDQLLAKCGDHAQLVTDKCVCLTGYEMDNQGACVAIAKLDLAAPVLTSTTLAAAGTLTSAKNAASRSRTAISAKNANANYAAQTIRRRNQRSNRLCDPSRPRYQVKGYTPLLTKNNE